MRIDLITLFPEVVPAFGELGVTGTAARAGRITLKAWNPREQAPGGRPDDRAFGPGPGMLLQAEPVAQTIDLALADGACRPVIYLSPQGQPFDQSVARDLATQPGFMLLCGRYEGVDQRVIDSHVDVELSLGDFVMSGGELPALAIIDTVTRLLPGVLGDENSATDESLVDGRLEYPHYTRPSMWRNHGVPPVLLSGDHAKIHRWRQKQALGQTWLKRPDLFAQLELDSESLALWREFVAEYNAG